MATHPHTTWGPGTVFAVPLPDGTAGLGQVTGLMMPNVVYCAFTNQRLSSPLASAPSLQPEAVIAALAVSREQLDYGAWPILGIQAVVWPQNQFANERFRNAQWIGAKVQDAAIAEDLLAAYFRLAVWDDWHDPEYLDKLLIRPELRPADVRLKRS